MRSQLSQSIGRLVVSALMLCIASSCGSQPASTYPVTGKVTYPDGSPVTGGMVEFEPRETASGQRDCARGAIQPDGSYSLSTFREGDGAVPGHHRVVVQDLYPSDDPQPGARTWKPALDPRFRRYETSGLQYDVKPEPNVIHIRLPQ